MKRIFLVLLFYLSTANCILLADEATLYYGGDQHTINNVTTYKLFVNNTSNTLGEGYDVAFPYFSPQISAVWSSDVYIRHADGSETQIGSGVAAVTTDVAGEGTWENCLVGT